MRSYRSATDWRLSILRNGCCASLPKFRGGNHGSAVSASILWYRVSAFRGLVLRLNELRSNGIGQTARRQLQGRDGDRTIGQTNWRTLVQLLLLAFLGGNPAVEKSWGCGGAYHRVQRLRSFSHRTTPP